MLLAGRLAPASWRGEPARQADFFAAKGLLGGGARRARRARGGSSRETWPFLHPGARRAVRRGERRIGFLGELHPLVARRLGPRTAPRRGRSTSGASPRSRPRSCAYAPFAAFPPVREDLAVVVGEDVAAGDVVASCATPAAPRSPRVEIFDVYRGAQVGEGRVSLALHLEFRAADRTLTDEEVAALRARDRAALAERLGGELRG